MTLITPKVRCISVCVPMLFLRPVAYENNNKKLPLNDSNENHIEYQNINSRFMKQGWFPITLTSNTSTRVTSIRDTNKLDTGSNHFRKKKSVGYAGHYIHYIQSNNRPLACACWTYKACTGIYRKLFGMHTTTYTSLHQSNINSYETLIPLIYSTYERVFAKFFLRRHSQKSLWDISRTILVIWLCYLRCYNNLNN